MSKTKSFLLQINTLFLIIVGLLYIYKIKVTEDRTLQILFGILGAISLIINIKHTFFNKNKEKLLIIYN